MFPLARYALSAIPDDTLAAFIAEAFMMRGEIDSAGMILRRRFDQMPSAIVSLALAKAHILRGRTAVADSLLHLALELEPQNPSNYIALAEFFAAIDLPDSASFFIERCNELIPDWKDCSK